MAPIPAAHRAAGQRQLGMQHHARRIEELSGAEAVAARAGADRRVEREQARLQLGQRVVAQRAGVARGENLRRGRGVDRSRASCARGAWAFLPCVHVDYQRQTLAQTQRGLERLGQALRQFGLGPEAIDHGLDAVLLAQ
ncbi:hypothetical protein B2A_05635, partial [mine drainage metagenome]